MKEPIYRIPSHEELQGMDEAEMELLKSKAKAHILIESLKEPMPWFKHDCDANQDDRMGELLAECGLSGYGAYFLLLEHLGNKPEHRFDVRKQSGWSRLAHDLYLDGPDQARTLMGIFAELEIIDRTEYERGFISNKRMGRQVAEAKEAYANKRYQGWCGQLAYRLSHDEGIPSGSPSG